MNTKVTKYCLPLPALMAGVLITLVFACTTAEPAASQEGQEGAVPMMGGAELWAKSCNRCHNFRSPDSLSDAQWAVAMRHMRIRANLTGEEERVILEFLQSGN